MTVALNPKPVPHGRTALSFRGYWMPSYCPIGLRETTDRTRGSVMVDAASVEWDGTRKTCTAHYRCDRCGHTWSEADWPTWALKGLGRKDGAAA